MIQIIQTDQNKPADFTQDIILNILSYKLRFQHI